MLTCSKCNATSPDGSLTCVNCNADLKIHSTLSVTLIHLQNNPRVRSIRITVANDSCPHCYGLMQTYPKNMVPSLPHQGCSHENGCRCFYEPVLEETAIVGKLVT